MLSSREIVMGVYCGTGTISLYLVYHKRHGYNIEIIAVTIKKIKKNA